MFAAIIALSLASPIDPPKEKEKELPEAAKKELKKFEGKWKVVSTALEGKESKPNDELFLEFKGRKVVFIENGKEMDFFEVASLDPSTTPKLLDFKALVSGGPLQKDTVYEGIYQLGGDDLELALYIGAGSKRPEKFESEKDSGVVVVTLKRQRLT